MKMLLVDHDTESVEVVSLALKMGWPDAVILVAAHGEQGLELAARESPDLVLFDMSLPDIGGYDFLSVSPSFPASRCWP